ncbi:ROK family protein [Ideonella sp. 4Y16]|uniref:ROK family protein n=1 Tax=Ideonella alba TaxID=2824118 RepID=A0A940YDV3_9BURK|nr:ROK family protein [Ideonella alba]MBQ0930620.1 ROK family protein [Ideonella alba]MBQ0946367.1 ROK family protein [Ideonella alba]
MVLSPDYQLCIDVGYTFSRFGVSCGGSFVDIERVRTIDTRALCGNVPEARKEEWIRWLAELVRAKRNLWPSITRCGLCFPGLVSAHGDIGRTNAIWGDGASDLAAPALSARLGLRVDVLNDLTAAAIRHGEDSCFTDQRTVLTLSVGSGIGSKIYDRVERRVVMEGSGRNGEIGLAVVDEGPEALRNANGLLPGILGNYASGVGFARLLRHNAAIASGGQAYKASLLWSTLAKGGAAIDTIDDVRLNEVAVACIQAGDVFVCKILQRSIKYLAQALHVVVLFDAPDVILLTGGFAIAVGEVYRRELCTALSRYLPLLYSSDEINHMVKLAAADDLESLRGVAVWLERLRLPKNEPIQ